MPLAPIGTSDADAHAVAPVLLARRTRTTVALHLCILPVEVQVDRAAHARAQVARAREETPCLLGGFGGRFCRRRGAGAMRKRHAKRSEPCCDRCAMKHARTVARAL